MREGLAAMAGGSLSRSARRSSRPRGALLDHGRALVVVVVVAIVARRADRHEPAARRDRAGRVAVGVSAPGGGGGPAGRGPAANLAGREGRVVDVGVRVT